jgi:hypothetical protein
MEEMWIRSDLEWIALKVKASFVQFFYSAKTENLKRSIPVITSGRLRSPSAVPRFDSRDNTAPRLIDGPVPHIAKHNGSVELAPWDESRLHTLVRAVQVTDQHARGELTRPIRQYSLSFQSNKLRSDRRIVRPNLSRLTRSFYKVKKGFYNPAALCGEIGSSNTFRVEETQ